MSNDFLRIESDLYPPLSFVADLTPVEKEEHIRCPFREFNGEFLRCYKNDCMAYYKNQNDTYLCSRLNPVDGSKLVNLDKEKE